MDRGFLRPKEILHLFDTLVSGKYASILSVSALTDQNLVSLIILNYTTHKSQSPKCLGIRNCLEQRRPFYPWTSTPNSERIHLLPRLGDRRQFVPLPRRTRSHSLLPRPPTTSALPGSSSTFSLPHPPMTSASITSWETTGIYSRRCTPMSIKWTCRPDCRLLRLRGTPSTRGSLLNPATTARKALWQRGTESFRSLTTSGVGCRNMGMRGQ